MSRALKPALAAALAALLAGGAGMAAAQPQDVEASIRQAETDARKAQLDARVAQQQARQARQQAERARDRAERADRVVVRRLGDDGDRTEHLRNILQLRPNQETALKTYVEALRPRPIVRRFDAEAEDQKTTNQRLADMEQRLAEREAASRGRIQATRAFYAQLDDRQKKAFDELPLMMGPDHFGPMPVRAIRFTRGGPGHDVHHELMTPLPPMPPMPPAPPAPPTPPSGI